MAKFTRMLIEAHKGPTLDEDPDLVYAVLVNPEKCSKRFKVDYDSTGGAGKANAVLKFQKTLPTTMEFELLFDATGVIEGSPEDLAGEIEKFMNVFYYYQGDIHKPYYLKVTWLGECFGAVANSLSLDYTLFSSDGSPLRARATLSLTNYEDAKTIQKESGESSPDLTHQVSVRAGETLPGIARRIYGETSRYLELARSNGLVNFRALRPGMVVYCPPVKADLRP